MAHDHPFVVALVRCHQRLGPFCQFRTKNRVVGSWTRCRGGWHGVDSLRTVRRLSDESWGRRYVGGHVDRIGGGVAGRFHNGGCLRRRWCLAGCRRIEGGCLSVVFGSLLRPHDIAHSSAHTHCLSVNASFLGLGLLLWMVVVLLVVVLLHIEHAARTVVDRLAKPRRSEGRVGRIAEGELLPSPPPMHLRMALVLAELADLREYDLVVLELALSIPPVGLLLVCHNVVSACGRDEDRGVCWPGGKALESKTDGRVAGQLGVCALIVLRPCAVRRLVHDGRLLCGLLPGACESLGNDLVDVVWLSVWRGLMIDGVVGWRATVDPPAIRGSSRRFSILSGQAIHRS
mmetsp:Transcript_4251/g.11062  ORF Transcript_4251/g.11062 Transcript_4251/m.11062 type:complete len:345 (-) Transcript_4251:314-1348(-)